MSSAGSRTAWPDISASTSGPKKITSVAAHLAGNAVRNSNAQGLPMKPSLDIADLKEVARRRVPRMFFDYADSGAWTESTYRANEADFARIGLRQRVLVDMSDRSLA